MENEIKHNSYGFRFKGDFQSKVAGLNAIGYELRDTHDYRWHGLHRGEQDIYIFQYTLNGQGAINIDNQTSYLETGEAFFVHVPSDHCYFLPSHSEEWEFIYFTMYGDEVGRLFQQIITHYGHTFKLSLHSEPIKHIIETLKRIETLGIKHGYDASSCAYTFIMKCLEYFEYGQQQTQQYPITIARAIHFIENNYKQDITLDDIVAVSQLSKYHFTRQFKKSVKDTPINYLSKTRVKQALVLLSTDELNIEAIALEVGYTSSNYFSKVFKKIVGVSPNRYRRDTSIMSVDKIFID
ncbi:AraC family transcriptional regulator [Staphylococcus sp. ACRSN]|uniref:AraC family transcriptional regulator n=1 Tax=Staphylococcus sp. ACRSN TaxID=2918214 RepID=UPI001EF38EDE|nr:AraC family transcriptional regulator [Staphylococcus sp. ACRSN]MCG7337909.1 AraC family transcriptional regulator [Staphylococcus sp. ACRSN]